MAATTTAIAVSAAANAQAAAANAAAAEAARKACHALVRGYENDRATVAEMRDYASCVDRLHPAPLTDGTMIAAKAAVLLMFAAVVAGVVWEGRNRTISDGWFGAITGGALIGLACGGGGLIAIAGLWFGVRVLLA